MKEIKKDVLVVLFVFVLFLSISLVSAYSLGESFNSLFSSWESGDVAPNVAKIIFAILVMFMIYALLDNTGLIRHQGVRWIISLLVSFLATIYIAPEEVYGLLVSYSALGLTLGAIVPFLILLGFTFAAVRDGSPNQIMLQWVAWIMFTIFMIYKSVVFFWFENAGGFGNTVAAVTLGMSIVALIMVFANKGLIEMMSKRWLAAEAGLAGNEIDSAVNMIKDLARARRDTASRS
jgi:hypothetical protein